LEILPLHYKVAATVAFWGVLQAAAQEAFEGGKEAGQALTSDKQNVEINTQEPGKLEVWEKKG
jgi:hypothetical protein